MAHIVVGCQVHNAYNEQRYSIGALNSIYLSITVLQQRFPIKWFLNILATSTVLCWLLHWCSSILLYWDLVYLFSRATNLLLIRGVVLHHSLIVWSLHQQRIHMRVSPHGSGAGNTVHHCALAYVLTLSEDSQYWSRIIYHFHLQRTHMYRQWVTGTWQHT